MPPPITIRPYQPGEAPVCHRAIVESFESLSLFMPWADKDLTLEQQESWIEDKIRAFAEGREWAFAIRSSSGDYLGGCGLNQVDVLNKRANFGYWVRDSSTGQGVATAAARLLVEWAFANTQLHRLEIVVSVRNKASLRVAQKTGAVHEGILKDRLFLRDEWHDAALYSVVR